MATMFRNQCFESNAQGKVFFDADAELRKHSWHPQMTASQAEEALTNQPPYTYITRPRETERGFIISFVNPMGCIEHHYFTLIDSKYGIWRNSSPEHVGSLQKVICDMMECEILDCKPL
jgi:hypothetical protein